MNLWLELDNCLSVAQLVKPAWFPYGCNCRERVVKYLSLINDFYACFHMVVNVVTLTLSQVNFSRRDRTSSCRQL
jgi:hypothetical protein